MKTNLITSTCIAALLSACGGEASSPSPAADTPKPLVQKATSIPSSDCETGTFMLTASGFDGAAPHGLAYYRYCPTEAIAFILLPGLAGTSNSTSFTASPLPSFLIPASIPAQEAIIGGFDNGVEVQPLSVEIFSGDSVLHFNLRGSQTGWTPSGAKGAGIHTVTLFLD